MKNLFTPEKFAKGSLVGCDGNAYALLGHFTQCARRSGWKREEIDLVIQKAMSGDYDALICTLDIHLEPEDDYDD